jgi:hypothetical protein
MRVWGKHCWENGIICKNHDEDDLCIKCTGYEPYRTTKQPEGMSMFQMWLGMKVFWYQNKRRGHVHPRQVIEGLERYLENFKWSYGETGIEKEPEWCGYCGWYCECGK